MATSTSPTKPTILLFPGAFHAYDPATSPTVTLLAKAGFPTTGAALPSVNDPQARLDDDIRMIVSFLETEIGTHGRSVIIALHSFAGIPGGEAIHGWSRTERAAKGQPGGILGVVFVAGLLPQPGQSLKDAMGGAFMPWTCEDVEQGLVHIVADPVPILFNETEPATAQKLGGMLRSHSLAAMTAPSGVNANAWASEVWEGRRVYVLCERDEGLPFHMQGTMLDARGVNWVRKAVGADHSPFVSRAGDMVRVFKELTGELDWM